MLLLQETYEKASLATLLQETWEGAALHAYLEDTAVQGLHSHSRAGPSSAQPHAEMLLQDILHRYCTAWPPPSGPWHMAVPRSQHVLVPPWQQTQMHWCCCMRSG